ncbi:uncharacterized protein K441DRAFT_701615 [Cenococcum geophilum 1.58]|uniref:Uncharacterized protein n=1 Tax=Cenococcum geophilum 1.58 TaxID=794803 RepID=A0ACC8EKS2_9PEZI|nr:hypothetical protein K441DRAFT_701615 [Cenococcum geophilum 1.58]
MVQPSIYINSNAEGLGKLLVAHEGQKQLTVEIMPGCYGEGVRAMIYEIVKNLLTPKLREWIMPNFTATTEADHEVASIAIMGAMQKSFRHHMEETCGILYGFLLGQEQGCEKILSLWISFQSWERKPLSGASPETGIFWVH